MTTDLVLFCVTNIWSKMPLCGLALNGQMRNCVRLDFMFFWLRETNSATGDVVSFHHYKKTDTY